MRKHLIILLIVTFFMSTTGLPLTLHYCQMQNSVSIFSCDDCEIEETEVENSCCPSEENLETEINKTSTDDCCVNKVIDSSVEEFLYSKSEIKFEQKLIAQQIISDFYNSLKIHKKSPYIFNSSLLLSKTDIILLNSVLLI